MSDTLLKDLIEIPTEVHKSDFVISLADGIDEPAKTVDSYVVTDQLLTCFDQALGLITSAVEETDSKGAYLHGSFGSGKSHFMAVLHLLLEGDTHARGKVELADVVARYDARLDGKSFLLVPYHMIGAASMEAGILGGYVDHLQKVHPEADLPGVYLDEKLLSQAEKLREQMGDGAFFGNLGGEGDDLGFGDLAGGWDAERFEAAVAAKPGDPERSALVSDFIGSFASHVVDIADASGRGFVAFDKGLDAISRHARGLGYDGVVLFLDELILWFASRMADPNFVNREGPKVAKLVEAASKDRPAPIVSFIARQRDLRDFLGQGVPGAEKLNFDDILQWWEGRFDTIELSDTNLRAIVEKRLLQPKDDRAAEALDEAFDRLVSKADSALDTLMTSDADRAAFRKVYPFSPAMIETLVAVSSYLQRERTALRLLLQLLVNKRDELTVGDLVPLGDLYDVIRGGEEPFSDDLKRHFVRAKSLYSSKLRPLLLAEHDLSEEDVKSLPARHPFRTDDRLVKTLLLAALVPKVDPLSGLTVRRLADLNHGSIRTPIPGHEKAAVLSRLEKWAPEVPELKLEGDRQDPTVSLQLLGVDTKAILDQAKHVDNLGARQSKIRELVTESLEIKDENGLFAATRSWVWRGSRRTADVLFANVRDAANIPDSEFRASGRPRVIIDFPFDEHSYGPADDLARINDELKERLDPTPTVAWLPLFLTEEALDRLGRLVVIDHVLAGDRLDGYTIHLSRQDRVQAGHLLKNQAEALRRQMRDVLRQAYGIDTPEEQWVTPDLKPREQFPSLDPTLDVRAPTASSLDDAFLQILDQVMAHQYPAHPHFEDEVRLGDLRTALSHVERAMGQKDHRVEIPKPDRKSVRKVLEPLKVATVGEAHIVLKRHWRDHFHQKQQANPGSKVTVERLKEWIDEPDPMGLDERVANFVIVTYAISDNRMLVQGGQVVDPDVRRLEPTTELRTQKLPPEEVWDAARPHAHAVFGVDASPLRSASNVSKLVDRVKEIAEAHADGCKHLVAQLERAAEAMGVEPPFNRLRTAEAGRDLLETIRAADDVGAVEALAALEPPTSDQALGRSIKSSEQVVEALDRANWELMKTVEGLPGEFGERGVKIVEAVADALQRDELVEALHRVLEVQEQRATALIRDANPPPPPEPKHPSEGSRENLSGDEARSLLRDLSARRGTIERLDITWRFRDE